MFQNTAKTSRFRQGVLIGSLTAAGITALLLCLLSAVLSFIDEIPYAVIDYAIIAVQGSAVMIGAYIAAALARSRGLFIGLICGVAILVVSLGIGLCTKDNTVTILTAIRSAVILLCGALGGIKGVNRKEKVRIR